MIAGDYHANSESGRTKSIDARCRAAIAALASASVCLTPFAVSGCTVYKAAAAPSRKDLTVLKPGTTRDRVIAELGPPVTTERTDGTRKDVFTFVQGSSRAAKTGIATVVAIEDIATLGAAELALGSEEVNPGTRMSVAVYYDAADVVTRSETILVTQP